MRSYERRVDVTGSSDLEGEIQTAVTVHLPDAITGPATIFFAWLGEASVGATSMSKLCRDTARRRSTLNPETCSCRVTTWRPVTARILRTCCR